MTQFSVNDNVQRIGDPSTTDTITAIEDRVVRGQNIGKLFTLANAGGPFTRPHFCLRWEKVQG